jgi:hypothetical protein
MNTAKRTMRIVVVGPEERGKLIGILNQLEMIFTPVITERKICCVITIECHNSFRHVAAQTKPITDERHHTSNTIIIITITITFANMLSDFPEKNPKRSSMNLLNYGVVNSKFEPNFD